METSIYARGLETMNQVVGEAGARTRDHLRAILPDFERMLVEFPFGTVYSRPGLDLKTREIATVAALTALGYAIPQLKVHIYGARRVGCTEEEIKEIMMQMAIYAGFPAALNGLAAAADVFAEEKREEAQATW
ncbi:carboxymuconolactone decarboxylase family protein [Brevibacillus fluminis]|uniref:Carboxymuconolactone decarboxylase family protein n=2 Tax=Brevibacillus fluminis TaxID=511487 RepID=A0A3M8CSU2_9BACL|nr:carboxymuconolactone decarboxylase family protein [Brevibacillus fluminis]